MKPCSCTCTVSNLESSLRSSDVYASDACLNRRSQSDLCCPACISSGVPLTPALRPHHRSGPAVCLEQRPHKTSDRIWSFWSCAKDRHRSCYCRPATGRLAAVRCPLAEDWDTTLFQADHAPLIMTPDQLCWCSPFKSQDSLVSAEYLHVELSMPSAHLHTSCAAISISLMTCRSSLVRMALVLSNPFQS